MTDKHRFKQELYNRLIPHPQTDPPHIVKAGHELFNQILKEIKLAEKTKENK